MAASASGRVQAPNAGPMRLSVDGRASYQLATRCRPNAGESRVERGFVARLGLLDNCRFDGPRLPAENSLLTFGLSRLRNGCTAAEVLSRRRSTKPESFTRCTQSQLPRLALVRTSLG